MPGFLSKLEPTRPRIDWQLLQEKRWKRMRVIMDEEGIDAIFTNVVDSVIYLTGWPKHRTSVYPGAYGTLILKDEVEPIIFCSEGDAGGMLADMMYPDIRVTPPWNNLWVPIIDKALSDYGLKKKNIGIEPRMPAGLYNNIVGTLDKVNFVNAVPAINRSRAVKNPEEIKAYEHTVSLVECGINAAVEAAKNSWSQYTEIDIGTIGMVELLNRGCTGPDIWVVSGERAAPVRRYSTEKIVRAGEMCVIDGPGSFNGFRSEFARTVWTGGKPSKQQKKIYQTVYQSLEEAKKIMKPGTKTSALEKACLKPVKAAGLEKWYGGYPYTGHGIGIRAEAFNITARYKEMETVLEEGMILNLEPAVWQDGVGGCRIEDTYLVTKKGCRVLSRTPYDDDLLG